MKHIMIVITIFAAFFFAAAQIADAQENTKVQQAVNEIVKKYENTDGVSCMTLVKGGGLELIKTALNKEFGKSFMKGVTSITIIEYSEASKETSASLRKDLDVFQTLLQDFKIGEEKMNYVLEEAKKYLGEKYVEKDIRTAVEYLLVLPEKKGK